MRNPSQSDGNNQPTQESSVNVVGLVSRPKTGHVTGTNGDFNFTTKAKVLTILIYSQAYIHNIIRDICNRNISRFKENRHFVTQRRLH